jgi:polar amino acid transport system substrate-binding protein
MHRSSRFFRVLFLNPDNECIQMNVLRRKALIASLLLLAVSKFAIADDAVLRVGTTPTGPPFSFLNPANQKIEGMMVDLAMAVGKDNNLKVQLEPMQFSNLVSALTSNKIDAIFAAMSPTEPRKLVVNFSDQVYQYGEGLVVPATDTTAYPDIQALKGKRIGAEAGTDYLAQLRKLDIFGEVVAYDTTADIMRDIAIGRIDAGVADRPILVYRFTNTPLPKLRLVDGYKPFATGGVNVAIRKDQPELLDKVNRSIAKFKQDGTLNTILAKWKLN